MEDNQITGAIVDVAYQIHTKLGADFIVENRVIVELKSVETITPVHKKQLLTYLRLINLPFGLLINFNTDLIKNGINRIINPQ